MSHSPAAEGCVRVLGLFWSREQGPALLLSLHGREQATGQECHWLWLVGSVPWWLKSAGVHGTVGNLLQKWDKAKRLDLEERRGG